MNTILLWINHYGYIGIFTLLMLGIVGLPVPDETLLAFTGFLISKGHLSFLPTLIAAFFGSICGITISYTIGRYGGFYVVKRYGYLVHFGEDRLARAHQWFQRIGKWSLILGYFIPGVRHLTALVAGASKLSIPAFAIFAYTGGFIWATLFISIGYFFGEHWKKVSENLQRNLLVGVGILVIVLLIYFLVQKMIKRNRPIG